MTLKIAVPNASAPVETHADWLELCALIDGDREVSRRDYIRDLGISDSTDGLGDPDAEVEMEGHSEFVHEPLADTTFEELADRKRACGGDGAAYPFELTDDVLRSRDAAERDVYTFLALLSQFGLRAGPTGINPEKLFEEVCAEALYHYLGGHDEHSAVEVFGFPRRVLPAGFAAAVDELCKRLLEGVSCKRNNRPKLKDQKDAKLDIIGWRHFQDRRPGKIIALGQCATGGDWKDKRAEASIAVKWLSRWTAEPPPVPAIGTFFVPHRTEFDEWEETLHNSGGILFDRCRIAALTREIPDELRKNCAIWSKYVIEEARKA
jgi:hypothetical protein